MKTEFKNIDIIKASKTYANLRTTVNEAGILQRSYFFYFFLIAFSFGGYTLSLIAIWQIENYFLLALASLSTTLFTIQIGGLMHDCGHRAIFNSTKNNDILGYICSGFMGMVYDNWKTRHNAHHAKPNQEDEDPDVEFPFIATSKELFEKKKGLEKALIRFQAYYYYALGMIVSFSNRLGTFSYFLKNHSIKNWWKFSIYLFGLFILFVLPFMIFPLLKALFVFTLIHISSGVYLANIFAPNHKGMPEVKKGTKLSFLEQQIMTSRNVKGGFLTDLLLVGLNYQIEHHLFPNCPRNKLKRITPYVRKICKDLDLDYSSVNFLESNKIIIRELHSVAVSV